MGVILGQLQQLGSSGSNGGSGLTSPIKNITLQTWGGRDVNIVSSTARQLLQASLLTGLLKHYPSMIPGSAGASEGVSVDLISSPTLAKLNGISCHISTDKPSLAGTPFLNLINVVVAYENGQVYTVTGSVFGSKPFIVNVHLNKNTSTRESVAEGNMNAVGRNTHIYNFPILYQPEHNKYLLMFIKRTQSPPPLPSDTATSPPSEGGKDNAISDVLFHLFQSKINVAGINFSRYNHNHSHVDVDEASTNINSGNASASGIGGGDESAAHKLLCCVSLDSDIPEETMLQLRSIENISFVNKISLC